MNHSELEPIVGEMPSTSQKIHAELDALQFGKIDRYLYFRQLPIGLGGQITGRLDSLRLALAFGRKAIFNSAGDPPYSQTYEPLCDGKPRDEECESGEPLDFLSNQKGHGVVVFDPLQIAVRHNENQTKIIQAIGERLGIRDLDPLILDGMILSWMKVCPNVISFVEASRNRLGVTDMTLGVHLRRGDKTVESAFVPASEVNRRIAAMHNIWPFESVFLASDSPRAPEEIQIPAGVALIFDREENRYNNANHKMLMSNPALTAEETLTAYKNIALLSACGGIIGQDNAHFATLAAAVIAERRGDRETVSLIDGWHAEKASVAIRLYFSAKRWARRRVRSVLPWLTVRRRMQKAGREDER